MKKIGFSTAFVLFIILYGMRIYYINKDLDIAHVSIYAKDEIVQTGNDYFFKSNEAAEGYTVQVLDAELVSASDFVSEYEEKIDLIDKDISHLYVVKIKVKNENNEFVREQGFDLFNFLLHGTNYSLRLDTISFKLANESMNGLTVFSLEKGTDMEFILPFAVMPDIYTSLHTLKKYPPRLLISEYPVKKMIELY